MTVATEIHLSIQDLAQRWQCTPGAIYGMRYRGEGPPAIRIGRSLKFRLVDVEAWEQAQLEQRSA